MLNNLSASVSELAGLLAKHSASCELTDAQLAGVETELRDTMVQALAANSNAAQVGSLVHGLECVGALDHLNSLEVRLKSLEQDNSSLRADQAKLVQGIWDSFSSQSRRARLLMP